MEVEEINLVGGVSSVSGMSEMMQTEFMQSRVPEEVHPVNVVPVCCSSCATSGHYNSAG